jgi:hypothetical protein
VIPELSILALFVLAVAYVIVRLGAKEMPKQKTINPNPPGQLLSVCPCRFEIQQLSLQLNDIYLLCEKILLVLQSASEIKISQLSKEGQLMAITGTPVGGSSTFQVVPNGAMGTAAPSWTVAGDPSITLSPSPDGDVTKIVATDASGDTNTSYTLSVSWVNSAGTTLTASVSVPILPAAPATSLTINQLS